MTDPGYNISYWNLHERYISKSGDYYMVNNISPLVFYHFSGFDPLNEEVLSKYQDRFSFSDRKDIIDLFHDYVQKLIGNNYAEFIGHSSYYDVEKRQQDLVDLIAFKKSIPIFKRIIRGFILRFIKLFSIHVDYYIR